MNRKVPAEFQLFGWKIIHLSHLYLVQVIHNLKSISHWITMKVVTFPSYCLLYAELRKCLWNYCIELNDYCYLNIIVEEIHLQLVVHGSDFGQWCFNRRWVSLVQIYKLAQCLTHLCDYQQSVRCRGFLLLAKWGNWNHWWICWEHSIEKWWLVLTDNKLAC